MYSTCSVSRHWRLTASRIRLLYIYKKLSDWKRSLCHKIINCIDAVIPCSWPKIRGVFFLGRSIWTECRETKHICDFFIWALVSILVKLFQMQECTSMTGKRSFHSTTVPPQKIHFLSKVLLKHIHACKNLGSATRWPRNHHVSLIITLLWHPCSS